MFYKLKRPTDIDWFDLFQLEHPDRAIGIITQMRGPRYQGQASMRLIDGLGQLCPGGHINPGVVERAMRSGEFFLIPYTEAMSPMLHQVNTNAQGSPQTSEWQLTTNTFSEHLTSTLHFLIRQTPKPVFVAAAVRQKAKPASAAAKKADAKSKKLLTIAKIARKLRQIEGGSKYEEACFFASKIGWEGICDLVEVGHPENDPNLMPSRYMILPGASDDALRKKGNLNNFPHTIHQDAPKQMSIYNLKQFLILGGHLQGEKPYWQTQEQHTQEELDRLKEDGGIETSELSALTGSAEMDSDVAAALNQFLGKQTLPDPAGGTSYTIKDGDTLSAIAEENDFPNWQSIWQNNKHIIKNPDLIFPGDEIELPDLRNDELEPWFHEFDNGQAVWSGSTHYQFPASYFSLTLADRNGSEIKEKIKSEFQGYLTSPHLFYCFNIQNPKEIQVLMPVCDSVSAGFKQNEFVADGITLKAFENVLYGDKKSTSSTGDFDAEDDEALTPDNVELV